MSYLEQVEVSLRSQVYGQDAAIAAIMPIVETFAAGLAPEGRPAATFLLLGPTGTGKTKTVEAFAKALHGTEKKLVKVNCGEFAADHEVAKILGSPPGYLGHRETNPLITQHRLHNATSENCDLTVVLFDEIEKAASSLQRALLNVLDKGSLTLGDNTVVNFEKTIIFMTSNLGAKQMQECLGSHMGFAGPQASGSELTNKLRNLGENAARRKFSPEFMNRIDATVTYSPLTDEAMRQIIHAEIEALGEQIHRKRGPVESFYLIVADAARDYLMKNGTSRLYGARELRRLMQRELVQPLARLINAKKVFPGGIVRVTVRDGCLLLTPRVSAQHYLDAAV